MSIINRRAFFNKVIGLLAVFSFSRVQAKVEFTWPSNSAIGSVKKQTNEFVNALRRGQIIHCRPGNFVINNPIRLDVNSIDIRGSQGNEKTRLHFLNNDQGGLSFRGAAEINISDIHLYWQPVDRTARHHGGAGCMLIKSTKISVSRSSIHGAPGAGFHFNQCNDIRAVDLFVENTLADGIHFQNSSNCYGYKLMTSNTGDDGVAIVDYQKLRKSSGFHLEEITVVGSRARGIAFVGAREGILKFFSIDKTSTNGLHIEQDAYYKTRYPENIQVISGKIKGTGDYAPLRNNTFGVNILRAKNIQLKNIEVRNSKKMGYFISHSQNIKLNKTVAFNTKKTPIRIFNSKNVFLHDVDIQGSISPFFDIVGVTDLQALGVLIKDFSKLTEVNVLFIRRSKMMLTENISIKSLELKSISATINKVFLIKASRIRNVNISYISKTEVNVLGGGKNIVLFKLP